MEKANSRIPKLNFGFRKPSKTNGSASEGNTPRGYKVGDSRSMTPTNVGVGSASGSNSASPNLSRTRSLRVPTSKLKSLSHSRPAEHDPDSNRYESEDYYPVNGGRSLESKSELSFLPRPRSKTMGKSLSNPNSRDVSPRRELEEDTNGTDDRVGRETIEVSINTLK